MELCKSQFINPSYTSPRTLPFRGPLTNQPGRGKERANLLTVLNPLDPVQRGSSTDSQHGESPVFLKHHYTD